MLKREVNVILMALAIIVIVTIITIIIVQSTLMTNVLGLSANLFESPTPQAGPTAPPAYRPLVDTDEPNMLTLRNAAIGFSLEYPSGWRKRESTLQVIIAPSVGGLDPQALEDSAMWIGIPAGDTVGSTELLRDLITDFAPASLSQEALTIGAVRWDAAQITFEAPGLGGTARALVATAERNEVPYFLIAVAPQHEWSVIEPTFRRILSSFRFTQQAVLRPTDATPPPTPTATPTPVIYVVQSGDTLGGIAIRYGVDMEALANRNGIEDPGRLRTGQQLIIPRRR